MTTTRCPMMIDGYQCEKTQFHEGKHVNDTFNPYGTATGDPWWDDDDIVERREIARRRRPAWADEDTLDVPVPDPRYRH